MSSSESFFEKKEKIKTIQFKCILYCTYTYIIYYLIFWFLMMHFDFWIYLNVLNVLMWGIHLFSSLLRTLYQNWICTSLAKWTRLNWFQYANLIFSLSFCREKPEKKSKSLAIENETQNSFALKEFYHCLIPIYALVH